MAAVHYPRLHKPLRYIATACGWLLYLYEWVHVTQETPLREVLAFALLFVAGTLLIHAAIGAWVAHNKRLAARGTRGRMTRYTVPCFSCDYLGRELVLHEALPLSQEVIVGVDGQTKFYLPAIGLHEVSRLRRGITDPADDGTSLSILVPELV